MIKRIVLLKLKKSYSAEQITHLIADLEKFIISMPYIHNYSWGVYKGKEDYNPGFTHCLSMEFDNHTDFQRYISDPLLEKFSNERIVPALENSDGAIVFNYEF